MVRSIPEPSLDGLFFGGGGLLVGENTEEKREDGEECGIHGGAMQSSLGYFYAQAETS
jgi:hypothetical protein